jgi:hypothetical protein
MIPNQVIPNQVIPNQVIWNLVAINQSRHYPFNIPPQVLMWCTKHSEACSGLVTLLSCLLLLYSYSSHLALCVRRVVGREVRVRVRARDRLIDSDRRAVSTFVGDD